MEQTCDNASQEIQDLFESLAFTSEEPHQNLNTMISDIIRKHIESNPNIVDLNSCDTLNELL
jgi:hypothetical protein